MEHKDRLYARPLEKIDDFRFDEDVARVFPDMISRSVPGYGEIIQGIALLAAYHFIQGTRVYDLGCSLGTVALAVGEMVKEKGGKIIAVDNSPAMLREAKRNIVRQNMPPPIRLVCADIRSLQIIDASVVVLNFTFQFIPPNERMALLKRIYEGLLPKGILIISEKVRYDDAEEAAFQEAMHLAFKKAHGYSDLEISQKRNALEKVLIPDSIPQHKERLKQVGFSRVHLWFRYFNFISLAAVK